MKNKLAVEIAEDVLKQIAAERYKVIPGAYLYFSTDAQYEDQFKESFANGEIDCNVCAIGSCFVSWINVNNEYTIAEVDKTMSHEMRKSLSKAFSLRELHLMECVFEGWVTERRLADEFGLRSKVGEGDLADIEEFHGLFPDPTERLIAMMEQIVEDDGEFKLV